MSKIFIGIIFFVSQFSFSEELSDFEKMLSGFPECKFDDVYLDIKTGDPKHKFLMDKKLKPEEIDYGVYAVYRIDEIFHGVHVSKLIIDAELQQIVGIYIDGNIDFVKEKLKEYFIYGYNKLPYEEDGVVKVFPYLKVHDNDANKTFLFCPDHFH